MMGMWVSTDMLILLGLSLFVDFLYGVRLRQVVLIWSVPVWVYCWESGFVA